MIDKKLIKRTFQLVTIAVLFVLLTTSNVHAVPITEPSGLSPGDTYRLAFVTSDMWDAMIPDIHFYNDFVTGVAMSVPELDALGATWTAIASTPVIDAWVNTNTPIAEVGAPIYNTFGSMVALNNADLWDGSLSSPILYDQNGQLAGLGWVWTGTQLDGVRFFGMELGAPLATMSGTPDGFGPEWIMLAPQETFLPSKFYALSSVITVDAAPVPEPATIILLSTGLVGLVGVGRKKFFKKN
jgi:hypothetical protein